MASGFFSKGLAQGMSNAGTPMTDTALKKKKLRQDAKQQLFERATEQAKEIDEKKAEILKIAQQSIESGQKVPKRLERVYDKLNNMGNFIRQRMNMPKDPNTFRAQLSTALTPQEQREQTMLDEAAQKQGQILGKQRANKGRFKLVDNNGQLIQVDTVTGESKAVGSRENVWIGIDRNNPENSRPISGRDNALAAAREEGLMVVPADSVELGTSEDVHGLFPSDDAQEFAQAMADRREVTKRISNSTSRLMELATNKSMGTGLVGDVLQGLGAIGSQLAQVGDLAADDTGKKYEIGGEEVATAEQFRERLKGNPEQFFGSINSSNVQQAQFASTVIDLAVELVRQKQERISNVDVQQAIQRITGKESIQSLTNNRNALIASISEVDRQAKETYNVALENAFEIGRIERQDYERLKLDANQQTLIDVDAMSVEDLAALPDETLLNLPEAERRKALKKLQNAPNKRAAAGN